MIDQSPALFLGIGEVCDEAVGVCEFEIIGRELPFGALEDLTISDALGPRRAVVVEIEDTLDTLNKHPQSLEPVGQFGRDRLAVDPADLLEISELADFH